MKPRHADDDIDVVVAAVVDIVAADAVTAAVVSAMAAAFHFFAVLEAAVIDIVCLLMF